MTYPIILSGILSASGPLLHFLGCSMVFLKLTGISQQEKQGVEREEG